MLTEVSTRKTFGSRSCSIARALDAVALGMLTYGVIVAYKVATGSWFRRMGSSAVKA